MAGEFERSGFLYEFNLPELSDEADRFDLSLRAETASEELEGIIDRWQKSGSIASDRIKILDPYISIQYESDFFRKPATPDRRQRAWENVLGFMHSYMRINGPFSPERIAEIRAENGWSEQLTEEFVGVMNDMWLEAHGAVFPNGVAEKPDSTLEEAEE